MTKERIALVPLALCLFTAAAMDPARSAPDRGPSSSPAQGAESTHARYADRVSLEPVRSQRIAPDGATRSAPQADAISSPPGLGPDFSGASQRIHDPASTSDASDRALGGILVSRQLLAARGLSVGDLVTLATDPSGARAARFRIAGVYEPAPDPMKLTVKRWEARMHLPDLVALTSDPSDPGSSESVTALNVRLDDPARAPSFAREVQARAPGIVALPTSHPTVESSVFAVLERFHLAIALVTVLGSTVFLMALMVMRAEERRETVGILRLIGLSRRRILIEVLMEGLLIAAAGAVFGILFAAATQGLVNRIFQWRYDTSLVFVRVTAAIASRCVALAVPLGVVAGLAASWTLLRREVAVLLRR